MAPTKHEVLRLRQVVKIPVECVLIFRRMRVVVVAAFECEPCFWLVGILKKRLAQADGDDAVGVAVALQERTLVIRDLRF